ncbi:MAG: DUF983 domain-containing protein [Pseudomonadota bacterium]
MVSPGSVSPFRAGLGAKCPRCGVGALYAGLLAVREHCAVCGLDFRAQDAGDGPAVFVVLILGAVVAGLAVLLEAKVEPPFWVHAAIWPPVIVGGAIVMLRVIKATLIALQFRHRREDFDARG